MTTSRTGNELSDRLSFMEFGQEERAALAGSGDTITAVMPDVLDAFYRKLATVPEVSRFFAAPDRVTHARDKQLEHWKAISKGELSEDYGEKVRRVGKTHARIGLEPRWYIGGYAMVLSGLVSAVLRKHWPAFGRKRPQAERAITSLVKATLLDMELAISVYLEESEKRRLDAEAAAKRAEDLALESERAMVVSTIGEALQRLAEKDLTCRMEDNLPLAYEKIVSDFNAAAEQVRRAMTAISGGIGHIQSSTREIAAASGDLAKRAEEHAYVIEETVSDLGKVTVTAKAHEPRDKEGDTTIEQAVAAMHRIEESAKRISQITSMIDEIAFQTNLLALNAGIEAARAGDAGRGFAVVASEVRALAQRSTDAAKEIKALIEQSQSHVEAGSRLVKEAGTSMRRFGSTMEKIDHITQQNAAMAEQSTAACHSLAEQAEELAREVGKFRIGRAA